jgi:hypothetical protein
MKRLAIMLIFISLTFSQFKSISAKQTTQKIEIDGLMEGHWNEAEAHSGFKQHEPTPLEDPTEKTEFRFLYDKENIYFYVTSYSENTEIVTQTSKRDNAFNNDWIIIALSPLNDGQTGYEFGVNPSNSQMDSRLYNDGWEDFSWDGIWYSETTLEDKKWTAEIKIPLRVLKFQSKDVQDWGINIIRNMKMKSEKVFWQEIDPDKGWKVSRFAKIQGLKGLESKNEFNLVPSIVTNFDSEQDYDPFYKDSRNVGFDLRYNLDEQHSILATYKPDFAQIEADPDVINLSDYPTYFQEKRPFFLEGNELYNFPDEVFYTRTMARPNTGVKFFGNQNIGDTEVKYGVTYVNNDGQTFENDGFSDPNEDFTLARVQIIPNKLITVGGFFGNVDTKTTGKLAGNLYMMDATYRPTDQFRFVGMLATTDVEKKHVDNHSARIQMNWDTDTFYSYFRFQKKSEDFDQGLIGFNEPNNSTEMNFNLGHRWRFKESIFRQARVNINYNLSGNYNADILAKNYNFNAHANHQFESVGFIGYGAGVNINSGQFRAYRKWYGEIGSEDANGNSNYKSVSEDSLRSVDYNNYGAFSGEDNTGKGYWVYAETDFSKAIAGAINFWDEKDRMSDVFGVSLTLQLKPSNDLKIRFNTSYQEYTKSRFVGFFGILRDYSTRIEYTIVDGLYAKLFTQYNPLADRLSNNLIMSYEYQRGSFMYLAYNETGYLQEDYTKGPIIKNYQLDRRTISLKMTYSFYTGI